MAEAPFNSSDLEFSEEEDSGGRIGGRAIASIVSQSVSDRIASKKTVKTLKDKGNSPGTTINRKYWLELFKQFTAATLGINDRADKTPTPEDVIRFIDRLPSHLQSRHSDGKIAWTVIKNAEIHLDRALAFHYPDYKLSRNAALRIDATIQKLLDDGQITKDPVREKQWLTCQVVKRLATAVLSDAVQNGTRSWDMTLAGTFSLVLQAAMASRSGDVMRSVHYTGDECLKWQDIELVATDSNDNNQLVFTMIVKLFYRKGHKRDRGAALTIELGQLVNDNDSVVDPVKLCIAYALRIGAVKETSWSDLLDVVRTRPSKRILWAKPTSPVFYRLDQRLQLDMSAPAPIDQHRRFLYRAADLVGMLNAPITHDIRRGAAADMYTLKSDKYSGDTNKVRRALGQSNTAMSKGTTDGYIGREKGDSWAARLDQAPKSTVSAPYTVQMATTPFKKQKVLTKDIDRYCKQNGLIEGSKSRTTARKALQNAQRQQWAEHQQSILDGVQPTTSIAAPHPQGLATGSVITAPVRDPLQDITNVSRTTSGFGTWTQRLKNNVDVSNDKDDHDDDDDNDDDEIDDTNTGTALVLENIDPALRTFAGDLLGIQGESPTRNAGSAPQGDSVVGSMVEGCISMWAASPSQANNEVAVLRAPCGQFIEYLSTVNLVSLSTGTALEGRATGNSRDPPSRFLFYCQTEGCSRSFYSAATRDEHHINCRDKPTLSSSRVLDNVQNKTIVPSLAPTTMQLDDVHNETSVLSPAPTTTKANGKRKKQDISKASEGFPKPCPDSAICGVTKPFATDHLLKNHRLFYHDANWPAETPCNFPGCQLPRDHYFISREQFRRHLTKQHLLNVEQAREYIGSIIPVQYIAPRGINESFLSTMCLVPDCESGKYTVYNSYTKHLKRAHGLTPEQYPQYMPTLDTVRCRPAE